MENIYLSLDSQDFYNISKVLSLINFDQTVPGVDVSTLAGKCKKYQKICVMMMHLYLMKIVVSNMNMVNLQHLFYFPLNSKLHKLFSYVVMSDQPPDI